MTTTKQSRTRRTIIEVGIAILLAVVASVIWNRVYLPSRPVAQVGAQTIDRQAYQRLSELDLAQQFAFVQQAINRQAQTGAQPDLMPSSPFGGDPQETLQLRDTIVTELRNIKSRLDTGLIDHWIDQEVILQGAAKEAVAVSDEQVNAALIKSFTSPDEGHSHEEEALEDETAGEHETATAQPSAAPEQTTVPGDASTLLADSYNELARVLQAEYGVSVGFSQAEFAAHVLRQQRVELLNERLEEKMLPASQTPKSLQVHAYFLLLPVQSSATSTEVVTNTPALDDAAFAEAKIKADELYQQLKQGADFVTLANQYTPSPEETVDPGWSVPDALWPSLREAVLNQPLGEIGQPVRTPSGWYIAKVLERAERPDRQKLEEERGKLLQEWNEQQRLALGVKRF